MGKEEFTKPAIEGGKPVRPDFLLAFRPSISDDEINEVVDTLKSGWITTGPKTHKFEEDVKNYIGSKHAIALSSCTAALHLSLVAAGVSKGEEVITTPLTFISTVNVILHQGAVPVFVDVDKETLNIDPLKIEKAITNKTKAIIAVHYAGQPCQMKEISEIAKKYNLTVIEDAAHAIGAEYEGKKIGTISDFTCFSFYAAKNMTTAEGGMICANKEDVSLLRIISLHGMSKDAWKRYAAGGSWHYEVVFPGYKYNMTDIQASMGIHQLKKLDDFISKKQKISEIYKNEFGKIPEITLPKIRENVKHAWYLYPILINEEKLRLTRAKFIEALKAENIGTSVHFMPVHLHPYYQKTFGFGLGDFPNAEYAYQRIISLPIHSAMSFEDVFDVVKAVKKIVDFYRI